MLAFKLTQPERSSNTTPRPNSSNISVRWSATVSTIYERFSRDATTDASRINRANRQGWGVYRCRNGIKVLEYKRWLTGWERPWNAECLASNRQESTDWLGCFILAFIRLLIYSAQNDRSSLNWRCFIRDINRNSTHRGSILHRCPGSGGDYSPFETSCRVSWFSAMIFLHIDRPSLQIMRR